MGLYVLIGIMAAAGELVALFQEDLPLCIAFFALIFGSMGVSWYFEWRKGKTNEPKG